MTDFENRIKELRADRGDHDREYRVEYLEDAGWGDRTITSCKYVECDHVEVDSGLVRFIDAAGKDLWAIRADRVIEYKDQI